jgi:carbon monoxide dehydrogenase subunit G
MHFEDRFEVNSGLENVWRFVTSPEEFSKIIPDLQSKYVIDETRFNAVFKMRLGVIGGSIKMSFEFAELRPMSYVCINGKGSGLQGTVALTLKLGLDGSGGRTSVNWSADTIIGGGIAGLAGGMLEPTIKAKIRELIDGVKKEVEKPS